MSQSKTDKLVFIDEDVSEEMQKIIDDVQRNIFKFKDSKSVLESIDKIFLFDTNTEKIYSKFASKLLILLFIFDYSRKLNNKIEDEHKTGKLEIDNIVKNSKDKIYYRNINDNLDKDKLLSWFISKGLSIFDDCLDGKRYTKLKDVINISTSLDLLKEYLSRVEDEFDWYEIISQFKDDFEKFPSTTITTRLYIEVEMTIEDHTDSPQCPIHYFKYPDNEYDTEWVH